jgi:hypothetical protein
MAADKTGFHAKALNFFMDNALDTSDICDDGVRTDILFKIFQILYIIFYRCTQENIITAFETLVVFFTDGIDHITADCCGKCFPILVIGEDTVIFVVFPDGLGD